MIEERDFRSATVFLLLLIVVFFSVIVWHYMKVDPPQTSATETRIESQRDTIDRQRAELEEALRLVHHIDSLFALQRAEVRQLAARSDSLQRVASAQQAVRMAGFRRMQEAATDEVAAISKLQKRLLHEGFTLPTSAAPRPRGLSGLDGLPSDGDDH